MNILHFYSDKDKALDDVLQKLKEATHSKKKKKKKKKKHKHKWDRDDGSDAENTSPEKLPPPPATQETTDTTLTE